jgi:PAS domain S-box-containing protein
MKEEGGKINILLVDDHPENLLALEAVLDAPEYHLVRAESGAEALKHLLKIPFSLILLDICMPGLDGFETASLIRERPKTRNIPIIFVTAVHRSEEDLTKGYAAGAVDYVIKPFDPDALKAKVAIRVGLLQGEVICAKGETAPGKEKAENEVNGPQDFEIQHYRSLVNAIPQILWISHEANGAIGFFNQAWFDYTGLMLEESEGWGWKRVVHPNDLSIASDGWEQAILQGKEYLIECRLKRADGAYRWHLLRAIPEKDSDGRRLAWVGTATDINDQKQAQERLRHGIETLEQKKVEAEVDTLLKSEAVSDISHELRAPLNAILGYSALLAEGIYGPIIEDQKVPIERIQRNTSELLVLVEHLMNLFKMDP